MARKVAQSDANSEERSVFSALDQDSDLWLLAAKDMYKERQNRSRFFSDDLFGEPAWDILLDLYIVEKQGRKISITSACLGAQVPQTTALRWLHELEAEGLVTRDQDGKDRRRRFVRISERGYAKMTAYFSDHRRPWKNGAITLVRKARIKSLLT